MVAPAFHTISHDMGWIPQRANTVRVAPVKTIIVASIPINNLIISVILIRFYVKFSSPLDQIVVWIVKITNKDESRQAQVRRNTVHYLMI